MSITLGVERAVTVLQYILIIAQNQSSTWNNRLNPSAKAMQKKRPGSEGSRSEAPALFSWPLRYTIRGPRTDPLIKDLIPTLKTSILLTGCYTIPLIIVMRIW